MLYVPCIRIDCLRCHSHRFQREKTNFERYCQLFYYYPHVIYGNILDRRETIAYYKQQCSFMPDMRGVIKREAFQAKIFQVSR